MKRDSNREKRPRGRAIGVEDKADGALDRNRLSPSPPSVRRQTTVSHSQLLGTAQGLLYLISCLSSPKYGLVMTGSVMKMPQNKPEDPDAQATITDFLDYTEYLPSDLNRALTLIGKLDETYLERADKVHNLSRQYGTLAKASQVGDVDPKTLRRDISYNLAHATKARESAYGEAERLHEMVNRHYNRLAGIRTKLQALPKPPSRDPTPVPRSPQTNRKTPPPKITLRLDGARLAASTGRLAEKKKVHRSRRVTVPGEVLPPPNPDSPQTFTDSDWESLPPSPLPMPTSRVGGSRARSHKPSRIRPLKLPKTPKDRTPRPPRPPGTGTNVHSSVAGISTSNALSMLPKPPPDAKRGSEHAPWMRLTEYEMALLRKRMKKNAIWTPSETMIRRELAEAGRGPDNYRKVKAETEETGGEFLDVDNIATTAPGKSLAPGEISADSLGLASTNLSNRGMKLNEAKKQKREAMLLASLQETQQAAKRLEDLGTNFKDLFKKPLSLSIGSPLITPTLTSAGSPEKDKSSKKKTKKKSVDDAKDKDTSPKKRKPVETPKAETALVQSEPTTSPDKHVSKKRKTQPSPSTATSTVTTMVPLAAPAPPPSEQPRLRSKSATPATPVMPAPEKPKISTGPPKDKITATSSRPRRVSLTIKGPTSLTLKGPASPPATGPSSRPASRAASRRDSTAPLSATLPRDRLRRKSATPATPTTPAPILTAAARRSKRPVPGAIVQDQEGGAAVTVGRRTKPPKKERTSLGIAAGNTVEKKGDVKQMEIELQEEEQAVGELVDPDEPRYCLCGDVSWGEMICCDNDNVSSTRSQMKQCIRLMKPAV